MLEENEYKTSFLVTLGRAISAWFAFVSAKCSRYIHNKLGKRDDSSLGRPNNIIKYLVLYISLSTHLFIITYSERERYVKLFYFDYCQLAAIAVGHSQRNVKKSRLLCMGRLQVTEMKKNNSSAYNKYKTDSKTW